MMTDQELKDLVASLAVESKKTDEQIKKTDEQIKKTNEQIKKTNEQIKEFDKQRIKSQEDFNKRIKKLEQLVGSIGNNQGDVAEEYFINSLKKDPKLGDMYFDFLIANYKIEGKNIKDEFDILLINAESVALIEVKYKVHPTDLKKLSAKIENLKNLPQYKGYKIYAGVAGFHVTDDVIKEAGQLGYFILQRKGDLIVTHFDNGLQAA